MIYPMKLSPVTKKIIWGGSRLTREYGKGSEPGEKIAESWELTCREDGINTIADGKYAGMKLDEYLNQNSEAVGDDWDGKKFPLLIKLIDAEDDLSIQVHPDDAYAAAHTTDLGKTEMWYIVDAAPDAKIIYGLKERYSKDQIRKAIADGKLEELMNYVNVKKGETYFIPAGMVHAICRGILIAEIQQNSNTTYRVYDYNRRQPDGTLRQLHVDDALNVIERFDPSTCVPESDKSADIIAKCRYFTVRHLTVKTKKALTSDKSFMNILCLDGDGDIKYEDKKYHIKKGDSYFIPAHAGKIEIISKFADIIMTTL